MKILFSGGKFEIIACPNSCIAHLLCSTTSGTLLPTYRGHNEIHVEIPLSLDNCEFLIEELQKIIEERVSSVPIHPILKGGRK